MAKNFTQLVFLGIISIIVLSNVNAQDRPFITIWQTDNPGSTEDNQIEIPAYGNYTIEWEEIDNPSNSGTASASGRTTVTFPSIGTYRVKLSGSLEYIKFDYPTRDNNKIIEVEQWGDIEWTQLNNAFFFCNKLSKISATDAPNFTNVNSLAGMFSWMSVYYDNILEANIAHWDVSNLEGFGSLFYRTNFKADLTNWDVSSATNMHRMFCFSNFDDDISHWDVSNVTNMFEMFAVTPFNQDISEWDVSSVTNFHRMFLNARNFNQNLGTWDISSVEKGFRSPDFSYTYDGLEKMFDKSNMSIFNYDSTLIGWSQLNNLPTEHEVGTDSLFYCRGRDARNKLIDEYGWSFSGDIRKCLNYPQLYPEDKSINVNTDTEIYMVFENPIFSSDENLSKIQISNSNEEQSSLIKKVYINHDTVFIETDRLNSLEGYDVVVPNYILTDSTGASNFNVAWFFRTEEIIVANKKTASNVKLKLIPNPFSQKAFLHLNVENSQTVDLLIYDLKGRIVQEQKALFISRGDNEIRIDRNDLASGLYTYILRERNGQIHGKFVIE